MTHPNRARLSKLTLGLLLALAAAPAFAQNTTAGVGGQVVGADGQPVAGAEVTIVHTESGTVSRALTDANGRYNARGLRVGGPYTITVNKAGAGTSTQEGVYLTLEQVAQVETQLNNEITTLGTVQAVAAGGSEVFSADKMGATTNIDRRQLEQLPSIKRDLQDYARLDPRISQIDKEDGAITVAGQNNRYNSVTIDAVNTSDTFGIEANNLPTGKQPISIDAIEAVNVNVSNYDVTQKGYTGANINAVTKSGTNDFHGTLTYVFRDGDMVGRRRNDSDGTYADFGPFLERTRGFTLGGPILKDRLFFFAAYEDARSTRNPNPFGPLGSDKTNVGITSADIARAQDIARTKYGWEIGNLAEGDTQVVKDALFKLDWNINDNHRASLRYNKTDQAEPIFPIGTSSGSINSRQLTLSSTLPYIQNKTFETLVGQWFADWSENFSTEFKISKRDYESRPTSPSRRPQVQIQFTGAVPPGVAGGTRTLFFGTERSRQLNFLATDTLDSYLAGTWYAGDHTLKFGADYEKNDVHNEFVQDVFGNYVFACLLASQCSRSFEAGIPQSFRTQRPFPGKSYDNAFADWSIENIGLFLQDTWMVNDNLTLMFGLRLDTPSVDEKPVFNAAAAAAPVFGTTQFARQTGGFGRRNDVTIDGQELIQPRFGFNYTFDTERRMQLRGGIGLFQGAAANVWLSNPYSNTGTAVFVAGCGTAGLSSCTTAPIFSPNPDTQPTLTGNVPAPSVDFIDPDLKQPSVWKANIAFEHELPWWDTVFSAEYLRTETKSGFYYQDMNLGLPTATGTDGRELYWAANGLNRANFGADGSTASVTARARSNSSFFNALIARPTGKGYGDNVTLGISRPMTNDWAWSAAYSWTDAKDVNQLLSSVSFSNWSQRNVFNPNEDVASRSNYVIKDRFIGSFQWQHRFFGDNKTSVGVFYEGRSGKPYSWTFINDMNGDGVSGNDLLYIPDAPGSGQVVFRDNNGNGSADEEAAFWAIVNSDPGLRDYAGRVVPRNSAFNPWAHLFDLRIGQEFPGFFEDDKTILTLDILNVGNLFNKKWGRIAEVDFPSNRSFVNYAGLDASGKYVYSVRNVEEIITRQRRAESQWAAQLTLQYKF